MNYFSFFIFCRIYFNLAY